MKAKREEGFGRMEDQQTDTQAHNQLQAHACFNNSAAMRLLCTQRFSVECALQMDSSNLEEGLFREMAYFHTRVCVKGGGDEMSSKTQSMSDKRTLSVEIKRPHMFMQPLAFDKGHTMLDIGVSTSQNRLVLLLQASCYG